MTACIDLFRTAVSLDISIKMFFGDFPDLHLSNIGSAVLEFNIMNAFSGFLSAAYRM